MSGEKINLYLERLEEVFQYLIRRLHSELARDIKKGITGSQFIVLKKLGDRGKVTVTEVAEELCVSLSAITALADRLCKAGYITRSRDQQDRRLVWLELTPEGKEILDLCQDTRRKVVKKYFGQLPESDLEKLIEIYNKIAQILRSEEQKQTVK